ncbi:MAG: hypothetical protein HKN33_11050 [Pyrinomonadaceae bacterium]|nr:hypothetical protein [Pyrinomonadaceae bacterium]
MLLRSFRKTVLAVGTMLFICSASILNAQSPDRPLQDEQVRLMTIPISIFTEKEVKKGEIEEFVQAGRLSVEEDKDEQEILSIRSVSNQPMAIAILLQDDLTSNINLQLDGIKKFIRRLPENSRVMVAYLRGGSLQVRQSFTRDLDAAAKSIRVIPGTAAVAPRSPFESARNAFKRFDGLPNGRRAVLFVSDGLDVSQGLQSSTPGLNNELDRAIRSAQRRGVAVYSFYSPATYTRNGSSRLILNGQSSLQKFSDETGGRAFFSGTGAPVSFRPFFQNLDRTLNRQFALTYLSTHMDSGFYKVKVESSNPEIRIDHPRGYYYRKIKKR